MDIQRGQLEEVYRLKKQKKILTPEEKRRRKKRRRKVKMIRIAIIGMTLILSTAVILCVVKLSVFIYERIMEKEDVELVQSDSVESASKWEKQKWHDFYAADLKLPELDVALLTVNEYSRPGIALPEVKSVFIHYTANPGTSALQNRSYFESLGETQERSASAHFIIDCDGSIVQCIPTKEIAYAVMKRNYDSISIECCYMNDDGMFTQETYESLIKLTAWLLHNFKLTPEDVLRHYDEGGKNCPKYYVENEEAWQRFVNDLEDYMKNVM